MTGNRNSGHPADCKHTDGSDELIFAYGLQEVVEPRITQNVGIRGRASTDEIRQLQIKAGTRQQCRQCLCSAMDHGSQEFLGPNGRRVEPHPEGYPNESKGLARYVARPIRHIAGLTGGQGICLTKINAATKVAVPDRGLHIETRTDTVLATLLAHLPTFSRREA